MAVNLKCVDGADAGTEVIFKANTDGGIQAVAGLIEAVRDRLNGGQHDGKVSPIVHARKVHLPASAVRQDLDAAADDRRLDVAGRSRHRRLSRRLATVAAACRAAASPARRLTPMCT